MSNLNRNPFSIQLKRGLVANINKTATTGVAVQGEPHYATDTKQLFVFDGTRNEPVRTLDMAVLYNDELVSYNDVIVYVF